MRILVTDDSASVRGFLKDVFERLGSCDAAADGAQAVDRFAAAMSENRPYDLVVMDIMMPGLSGHEAVSAIRAMEREHGVAEERMAKVVMLSSLGDPKNILQAQFVAGADVYLTKPVKAQTLIEAAANLGLTPSPLEG